MLTIILISVLFFTMLACPFIVGLAYIGGKPANTLFIRSDNIRNPRYFGDSFRKLIDSISAKRAASDNKVFLSKEEPLVFGDELKGSIGKCEKLVIANNDFTAPQTTVFEKEIYAKKNAVFGSGCILRAIAVNGALTFSRNCTLVRWADCDEELTADENCDLGVSASSARRIILSVNCRFKRLFAQEILIQSDPPQEAFKPYRSLLKDEYNEIITQIQMEEEETETLKTLVASSDLVIGSDTTVFSNIKSAKDVRVKSGARIVGNLVADGCIIIEGNVSIDGTVFSQESVFLGPNCRVGKEGMLKSVVARESIALCLSSRVYGYVHCERGGRTVNEGEFNELVSMMIRVGKEKVMARI